MSAFLPILAVSTIMVTGLSRRHGSRVEDLLPDLAMRRGHGLQSGDKVDVEGRYRLTSPSGETMVFDSSEGAGSTPNNKNVVWYGYTVWITPAQFLSLNDRLDDGRRTNERLNAMREASRSLSWGPPMLYVEDAGDSFKVRNHEGRHRMTVLSMMGMGDTPVPVHVITSGLRSRDLDPEDLLNRQIFRGSTRVYPRAIAWAPSPYHEIPKLWVRGATTHGGP